MQPFYQDNLTTIYHADVRDVLGVLPDVVAIITDPPYAEETHEGARTNPIGGHNGRSEWAIGGNEGQPLIDFPPMTAAELRAIFAALAPRLATWLISFMDWHHIAELEREPPAGLRFVRFGVWVKPNGAPQFTGDRPATGWEGIAIMHRAGGRMAWNGGGHHAVYTCNKISDPDHKTAKPPALVAKLIEQYTNPGDLILDPFMGIGTTLQVARRLGRRAIGVDIERRYCEIARARLARPLFGTRVATGRASSKDIELPLFD